MEAHWKRAASASWYNVYYVRTLGTWDGIAHVMYRFSSFRVAIGVCYHTENNHMTMFIIRNAYYQWLLYTPHLLKLSNSFKPLWNHNILLFIYLPDPPPPTAHMPSYTAICVISLSNSVVLNYILHESTNWASIKSLFTHTILPIT